MLSLETTDDWSCSIAVTVGAATETYVNSASNVSAYNLITSLVAWANHPSRSWSAVSGVFSWGWQPDPNSSKILIMFFRTQTNFSVTFDATAGTRLGLPSASNVLSVTATSGASGTWAPGREGYLAVSNDFIYSADDDGDLSGAGAVRGICQGLAGRAPQVSAIGSAADAAALSALMASARNPRRAPIYQLHRDRHISVAIGDISRSSFDSRNYRFQFQVAGDNL